MSTKKGIECYFTAPDIKAKSAILMTMPFQTSGKYLAYGVLSTSGAISSTLGRG